MRQAHQQPRSDVLGPQHRKAWNPGLPQGSRQASHGLRGQAPMHGDIHRVHFRFQRVIAAQCVMRRLAYLNTAGCRIAGLHGKSLLPRDLIDGIDGRISPAGRAVFIHDAQSFEPYRLVKQPQLPLIALGLDTRVQILLSAIERALDDAGANGVAGRDHHRGHRRAKCGHVLPGPGSHGDDQVDVVAPRQARVHRSHDGGTLCRVEISRLPVGVPDKFQRSAARVPGKEFPRLLTVQARRDVWRGQPAQLLKTRNDDTQDARIVLVVSTFVVAQAPFGAIGLGVGIGGEIGGLWRSGIRRRRLGLNVKRQKQQQ
ncbi:hypothetical protein D3C71_1295710 [compost metagenome]